MPRFPHRILVPLGLLAALACARSAAAGIETHYDNDTQAMVPGSPGTDRNYTYGLHATWTGRAGELPAWADRLASRLARFGPGAAHRLALSAGQELYTPDAILRSTPVLNDRPYAAWLFAGATLSAADARRARSLDVRLGVVGPAAQGEAVQTWWHRREHDPMPRGWANQLANEPGLRVSLDQRWRPWGPRRYADLVPHARLTAGNVLTEAAAGATLRIGPALPNDFGPGAPSGPDETPHAIRLFAFTRLEGRLVAHDVFLDGNTFAASQRVTRVPGVAEWQAGVAARRGALGLGYTFSYTTRQFAERNYRHQYGSVGLSF